MRRLTEEIRRIKFAPGEIVFKQGDKGESCYLVSSGSLRGEIVYEEKEKRFISDFKVGRGEIFGEMSLFTGMPRTATGIVMEESDLLEIEAEDFARMLEKNPKLAKGS